jgi:hypothetical protein
MEPDLRRRRERSAAIRRSRGLPIEFAALATAAADLGARTSGRHDLGIAALRSRRPAAPALRPPPIVGPNRGGRRNSPSISRRRKFRLKWAVKGLDRRRRRAVGRRTTPVFRRPTARLDSPFQSEKGFFQEIDGEWRRLGSWARESFAYLNTDPLGGTGQCRRPPCCSSESRSRFRGGHSVVIDLDRIHD